MYRNKKKIFDIKESILNIITLLIYNPVIEKIEVKKLRIWVCDIKQTKEKIGNVGSLNKMHEIHAWQYN